MREIKLTQGKVALVDDNDFEWLNERKWCAHHTSCGLFYATRTERDSNGKQRTVRMHREILNAPFALQCDHRDGDTLNNQKDNLRVCNSQQNHWNRRITATGTSRFKGVSWFARDKKWVAFIKENKKSKNLGLFGTEIEAAQAYNQKATELFGDFARINEI